MSPPCLIQLPPLKTAAVSWGSYGWEWSVAGLSVLAHTYSPPALLTSRWQANHRHHSSGHSILSTTVLKHSRIFFDYASSPLSVHPHAGAEVLFILTHRIFLVLLMQFSSTDLADGVGVYFSHRLICGFAVVSLTLCFVGAFFTFWGRESVHFHAQKYTLFDLTQPGGEPIIGCHSRFSTVWNQLSRTDCYLSSCCDCCCVWDCCNSLGIRFGHDRAKNDSGIVFPV